jgi:hypothetical protein
MMEPSNEVLTIIYSRCTKACLIYNKQLTGLWIHPLTYYDALAMPRQIELTYLQYSHFSGVPHSDIQ